MPSERVICRSDRLAALDTAMVALFEALERRMDASDREDLDRVQTAWRASRDACGRRRGCIARAYAQRIEELTGELVPFARSRTQGLPRAGGSEDTARLDGERVEQRRREQEAAAEERLQRLERRRAEERRAEERRERERELALRQERRQQQRRDERGGSGNRFSFERTTRASGFCTSFLDRRRAREIACRAEFTRLCERSGGGRQCRDVQRFTAGSGRDVLIEFQGERVTLNGEPAARVSRDCVEARDGLGFCFATERGARMPRQGS